jgi:hypothetical protein
MPPFSFHVCPRRVECFIGCGRLSKSGHNPVHLLGHLWILISDALQFVDDLLVGQSQRHHALPTGKTRPQILQREFIIRDRALLGALQPAHCSLNKQTADVVPGVEAFHRLTDNKVRSRVEQGLGDLLRQRDERGHIPPKD